MRTPKSGKPYFAVIDFEATCWDEGERRADQEIIEIGCVVVERMGGEPVNEFDTFVRPVRYPELSDFCTELTTITQRDVDTAPTFPNALGMMQDMLGDPLQYIFCSWGEFDRFILTAACRFHRVPYPFDDEYLDLADVFADKIGGRKMPMQQALLRLGLDHEGTLHRGIDDARNIARILGAMHPVYV
jgi:inhibitor of KinA sporulation pathway (predicted exonuclease)